MKILIERVYDSRVQTIGRFHLLNDDNSIKYTWDSLELPWRDNRRNVSCIPTGTYRAIQHVSPKFGKCLWLQNVPDRSEILVHAGNFYTDILGCILIGSNLKDINGDGHFDVTSSRASIKKLMGYLKGQKEIEVQINEI